ncbi:MAG: ABC transporter ATP-binding protein [Bacteroidetes bacterium]|nr:ABC transporter ATP-binding protein [Bacteroidota bacterium]
MPPLLSIENLRIRFAEGSSSVPAVHSLSLSIEAGAFLGLVGESGSGKSVTALSILQLLPQSAAVQITGKIFFYDGQKDPVDLLSLPNPIMNTLRGKRIGMVFQEPMTALNPLLPAGEQIAEVLQKHKSISRSAAQQETLKWMERVQLPDPAALYHRYPHQLSGGQKQRILIAAAICCGPNLLICDEPTTALDVTVQKEIMELIREEQKRTGMAVLFISHDLALVSQYADQVAVLYKGELMELGNNPVIFQKPAHPYTQALIACRPAAHRKGQRLPLVSDFLSPNTNSQTPTPSSTPLPLAKEKFLEVDSLDLGYATHKNWGASKTTFHRVVRSVSFDIRKGEMLGLVGESGSGKSTLGRAMLGLIKPLGGSIWYQQTNLAKIAANKWPLKRNQLQLVFQDPYASLNPRMTIGEAIGEPLRIHGKVKHKSDEKKQVQDWLERVQLNRAHYNRYPHEFSGGQRQRIVIARALALEPSFVVCDESVSALDVSIQAQVLNLLNDLRRALGFTCLFISHDLSVVRYLCDRMIVLKEGQLVEAGPTEQVCTAPQDPYTQNLLQAIPQLESGM